MNANERARKNPELRDTFAAAALQGLVASNFYDRYNSYYIVEGIEECIPRVAAMIAYEYADAMLECREVGES